MTGACGHNALGRLCLRLACRMSDESESRCGITVRIAPTARIGPLCVDQIAAAIGQNPSAFLGTATGSTPHTVGFWKDLQQRAASGSLDLKDATFVEPDEWVGLPKGHPGQLSLGLSLSLSLSRSRSRSRSRSLTLTLSLTLTRTTCLHARSRSRGYAEDVSRLRRPQPRRSAPAAPGGEARSGHPPKPVAAAVAGSANCCGEATARGPSPPAATEIAADGARWCSSFTGAGSTARSTVDRPQRQ